MRRRFSGPFDLEAGSSEPYNDAALYDYEYRRRRDDVRFYRKLARESGGPVLELGCGSGRVLVPMVRDGLRVFGIDRSAAMLAKARATLASLPPRVRQRGALLRADMRHFSTARRFSLVVAPFNAMLHLYHPDAVLRCLRCVRAALVEGGQFAFDIVNPDPSLLAREGGTRWSAARFRHPSDGRIYRYGVERHYDRARQIAFVRIHHQPLDGASSRLVRLAHRMIYPRELEALLRLGGFRLVGRWGGFLRQPLDDRAVVQVCLAAPDGK